MCLFVQKSFTHPVAHKPVTKRLTVYWTGPKTCKLVTPYRGVTVPFGDGHVFAKDFVDPKRALNKGSSVSGGYIHSYTTSTADIDGLSTLIKMIPSTQYYNNNIKLKAIALDVYALGDNHDVVSRGLYIPAMDVRNYTAAQLRRIYNRFEESFNNHTHEILEKSGHKFRFK